MLSGVYLLLNAASHDGEILHAHACRACAGHVLGFMSIGVIVKKIMTFSQNVGLDFCSGDLRQWVDRWDRLIAWGLYQSAGCSSVLGRYSDVAGVSLSDWPCVFNNVGRWHKWAGCSSSMQLPLPTAWHCMRCVSAV